MRKTSGELIAQVVRAWTDSGPNQGYHLEQKYRLLTQWPTLFNAIAEMVSQGPGR